jgi:NAD(P)-dependent dehydrogenase (short-subunit alcohol dehydrogenase family)
LTSLFSGKVAIVTGAASGIGAASARRLAREGAHVLVADVADEAGAALAQEIDGRFARLDVGDPDAWDRLVGELEDVHGGVDLAHLNAGVAWGRYPVHIEHTAVDDYRRVVGVNADGVFFGIRSLVPAMTARGGGAIVATSSLAGIGPHADDPVYAATKHFVVGLVRSLAKPLAEHAITVNAVCPGGVDTPLLDVIGRRDRPIDERPPLMDPDVIAEAVASLLAGDTTGEIVAVLQGKGAVRCDFTGITHTRK